MFMNIITYNNNRMCVCVFVISEQLNQENSKSYGTGFSVKCRDNSDEAKW